MATPLALDDRIYFVGETGKTEVLKAGRQVERLASNELWAADEPPANASSTERAEGRPESGRPEGARVWLVPRQYAVIAAKDTLLIRRGDKLYALRSN